MKWYTTEVSSWSVSGQSTCIAFPDCTAVAMICVFCKFGSRNICNSSDAENSRSACFDWHNFIRTGITYEILLHILLVWLVLFFESLNLTCLFKKISASLFTFSVFHDPWMFHDLQGQCHCAWMFQNWYISCDINLCNKVLLGLKCFCLFGLASGFIMIIMAS